MTTPSIKRLFCDTQHNNALPLRQDERCAECLILFIVILNVIYAECHYAESHCAECHYAECHYIECHYSALVQYLQARLELTRVEASKDQTLRAVSQIRLG